MFAKLPLNVIATITLAIGLISCGGNPEVNSNSGSEENSIDNTSNTAKDKLPLVVTTSSVVCNLTKQIVDETVNLKCLLEAGADPHTYQPKPEDRKALEQADLILYGGYNYEPGIIKLIEASSNTSPKVAVHEVAVPKPIIGENHDHDHDHGHDDREEEKAADPHVWHNPKNGIQMLEVIRNNLEKISPENENLYTKNAEEVTGEIKEIDSWIKRNIATIPENRRKLVTTHDALSYYTEAYNIKYKGAIEGLSTEAEPTAARIGQLSKKIKQEKVPTIFAESTHSSKLIKRIAQEANVKVSPQKLFADGLGEGDSYQEMLIANTKAIVEGLGGEFQDFEEK